MFKNHYKMTVKITTQIFRKDPSVSRLFFAKKHYFLGILAFFLAFLLFNSCASKIPTSTFAGTERPAAPNYNDLKNWAAHPDKHDNADSIPMNSGLKDGQSTAEVDVFFVHPTTFTLKKGVNVWNADLADAALNQKTDNGSILFQASIFNEVGRIYAPRYRQAYYGIYLSRDTASNRPGFQFPPQYSAITEQHQPAELIPQFSTIEYTLMVRADIPRCLGLANSPCPGAQPAWRAASRCGPGGRCLRL